METEERRGKKFKNKQCLSELWDNIKQLTGVCKKEGRSRQICRERTVNDFPDLVKNMNLQIKNFSKTQPAHPQQNCQKTKNAGKVVNAQERRHVPCTEQR